MFNTSKVQNKTHKLLVMLDYLTRLYTGNDQHDKVLLAMVKHSRGTAKGLLDIFFFYPLLTILFQ